ncbi:MAG: septum formation initiator family protein [Candidatus Brocadiaceae bacterium]|jgi:cell division protein FtsB
MGVFSARSFWLPVLLTTLVAAFFGAVLARRGRDLRDLLEEKNGLRAQLEDLKRENAELRSQRDDLLSSPRAIERVAREEYGFAAPGEKVDRFEAPDPEERLSELPPEGPGLWSRLFSWKNFPMLLPAAVLVLTAIVFAVWNAVTAAGPRPE